MSLSDRVELTLERWSARWKDRLAGWMASWVMKGATAFLESEEPQLLEQARGMIDRVLANPESPTEIKTILAAMRGGGQWIQAVLLIVGIALFAAQLIQQLFRPGFELAEQQESRKTQEFRLDPLSTITAWRRDPEKYAWLFDDLRDQGWSEKRIEALKFLTLYYPSPAELIHWTAREVFEKTMIDKYQLRAGAEDLRRQDFYKAGMDDDQIDNHWIAHWEHASWLQVVEMLHRGLITEQDVKEWFPLVEIAPYWADLLIETAYSWPTRVDVRRFYDLRTIDEARLREIYQGMGYRGKNLDDYVLWTKIYVELPDLLARWKNGWISLDAVRDRLVALGMSSDAADELIQTRVKSAETNPAAEGKQLTKTEIYRGVKQGVITYNQGIELLMDLDYTQPVAEFLLVTNVQTLTGSPGDFVEFKEMTQLYRVAAGLGGKAVPEELKQAGQQLIDITSRVSILEKTVDDMEAGIADETVLAPELREKLDKARTELNRAQAEKNRIQTDYDAKLAAWRQGG